MLVLHRLSKTIQKIEDHFWKQREKNILRVRNSKQLINYGMCRFVSLYSSTRMINVKDNGQLSNSNVYTVEDIYYLFFRNRGKPSHQKKINRQSNTCLKNGWLLYKWLNHVFKRELSVYSIHYSIIYRQKTRIIGYTFQSIMPGLFYSL